MLMRIERLGGKARNEMQAVGERRRVNWGDLLDEVWGKDTGDWAEKPLAELANSNGSTCITRQSVTDGISRHVASNARQSQIIHHSNFQKINKLATNKSLSFTQATLSPEVPGKSVNCSQEAGKENKQSGEHVVKEKHTKTREKQTIVASTHKTIPRKRSKTTANWSGKKKRKKLQQLCLDLGQKRFGHVTCKECGMVYSVGLKQDEGDHVKFHKKYLAGVSFNGWKRERIVAEFLDGRIIVVYPSDPKHHMRKVQELCTLVDSELGYAVGLSPWRATTMMFLFVSTEKRIMGCVFAEKISEGYPVLSPSVDSTSPVDDDDDDIDSSIKSSPGMASSMTSSITSSPRSLTSDSSTSGSQLDSLSAWYCSSTPQPAVVGINRVWVCQQHRRMGVATRILDTIRFNFLPGSVISKDQIAFSDPTPSGKAFAASYCGTENFLVYHWTNVS